MLHRAAILLVVGLMMIATVACGSTATNSSVLTNNLSTLKPVYPNSQLHPGATDPNVTQSNINSTICKSGYTKTVRPPESYTNKLKAKQIKDEGLSGTPQDYEEDHLISLEIGGAPEDPQNLWPEPYEKKGDKLAAPGSGSETKDKIENKTHDLVCSGQMSLSDAQNQIASDWYKLGKSEGAI